jgi:hypothetical protein
MSHHPVPPDLKIVLVYGYEPSIAPACQALQLQFKARTCELIVAGRALEQRRVSEDTSQNRKIIIATRLHEIIQEGFKVIVIAGIPACIDLSATLVSDFGEHIVAFNVHTAADIAIHRLALNRQQELAFRANLDCYERSRQPVLGYLRSQRKLHPDVLGTRAPMEQARYMRNRIAPSAAHKVAVLA